MTDRGQEDNYKVKGHLVSLVIFKPACLKGKKNIWIKIKEPKEWLLIGGWAHSKVWLDSQLLYICEYVEYKV